MFGAMIPLKLNRELESLQGTNQSEIGASWQRLIRERSFHTEFSSENFHRAKLSRPYSRPVYIGNRDSRPRGFNRSLKARRSRFKNFTWMEKFRSEGCSTGQK